MKRLDNVRVYAWVEFAIWLIVVAICVLGIRYNHYKHQQKYKNYQIFMEDVDGLIVGSPVKFLGVQIGHVKDIRIVSSNVYIKFIITQENLSLPIGSIATVEAFGLGGSKALEIYPPNKDIPTDQIIVSKNPTRLSKVMSLFDSIFREIDAIFSTIDYSVKQFDFTPNGEVPKNIVIPEEQYNMLNGVNESLDTIIKTKDEFMNNINK